MGFNSGFKGLKIAVYMGGIIPISKG
jgi:hypothetical protein